MNLSTLQRRTVAHFGSLRTTLVCLLLLAAAVAAGLVGGGVLVPALAVAIGLLALNLLAALVLHPAFRRQLPLLVAHLALLALVVLVAVGRLTALDGRFELTQGLPFDGLIEAKAGPLHRDRLSRLDFRHEGFEIHYAPGRKRGATRNPVTWTSDDGQVQRAVIGDHRPLVLDGYRIYTSSNKGFAPMLTWLPNDGEAVSGAVHLPSFPVHELQQSREWTLPGGQVAWVLLQFDDKLIDPTGPASFRLPDSHRLVLRVGEQRAELAPGERVAIPGGTLVYERLSTWMGYRVSYDATLPWLLAASLLAALSLAWHYTQRFVGESGTAPARSGVPTGRTGMDHA
jgi:ResB-like family